MNCKNCKEEITIENCCVRERGRWRKNCLSCENKRKLEWSKLNRDKKRATQIKYVRKIGIGIEHPCFTCKKPCKKKYKIAYCSYMCRFMAKVNKKESCWEWTGKIGKPGYGVFGSKNLAHRVSYKLFNGEIPVGMCVCHSCDNRICVKPDHLWVGTHQDNMDDCLKKGRHFSQKKDK